DHPEAESGYIDGARRRERARRDNDAQLPIEAVVASQLADDLLAGLMAGRPAGHRLPSEVVDLGSVEAEDGCLRSVDSELDLLIEAGPLTGVGGLSADRPHREHDRGEDVGRRLTVPLDARQALLRAHRAQRRALQ